MLVLLGLLSISMLGLVFFDFGSNDDTSDPDTTDGTIETDPIENITGTDGDDTLSGTSVMDFIQGLGGDDLLLSEAGNDRIEGGDGDDRINGGAGNDSAHGGAGNDSLQDREGDDTLFGGDGNDFIHDEIGANLIDGGAGNDNILSGSGSTITSGEGADQISILFDPDATNPAVITDFESSQDTLISILVPPHFAGQPDRVPSLHELSAVERADGLGTDIYFNDALVVEVMGAHDFDLNQLGLSSDVPANGSFSGDTGDDRISGSPGGAENIDGGAGDDWIIGRGNFTDNPGGIVYPGDTLIGGEGNDTIISHTTHDEAPAVLSGGDGNDILLTTGAAIMTGGAGQDIFGLSESNYPGRLGHSTITDFDPAEDLLYLEAGYEFNGLTLSVVPWDDGLGTDVFSGSELIARVTGGQSLEVSDIRIAENGLEVELLGYH